MSSIVTMSAKEALSFSPTKRTLYSNLASLVQYLQVEYGGGWQESTIKALVVPGPLMSVAEKSANSELLSDQEISEALNPIEIIDGVPTISDLPVWDQLSGEPTHYYNIFQRYLRLKEMTGRRSVSTLAAEYEVSARDVNLISKIYHWQYRVIPYDRQREEDRQIMRQLQAEALDQSLGKKARDMIEMASCYLEDHVEQLTPKMAIELMKVMVPIARVAVGLPGTAPMEERKAGGTGGGSGKTDVNVNINNAIATGDNSSVHGLTESEVIDKMKKQNEDPSILASIANVLIQSGAMESTVINESDAIDADFIEEDNYDE